MVIEAEDLQYAAGDLPLFSTVFATLWRDYRLFQNDFEVIQKFCSQFSSKEIQKVKLLIGTMPGYDASRRLVLNFNELTSIKDVVVNFVLYSLLHLHCYFRDLLPFIKDRKFSKDFKYMGSLFLSLWEMLENQKILREDIIAYYALLEDVYALKNSVLIILCLDHMKIAARQLSKRLNLKLFRDDQSCFFLCFGCSVYKNPASIPSEVIPWLHALTAPSVPPPSVRSPRPPAAASKERLDPDVLLDDKYTGFEKHSVSGDEKSDCKSVANRAEGDAEADAETEGAVYPDSDSPEMDEGDLPGSVPESVGSF